jgi:hypothetical protein
MTDSDWRLQGQEKYLTGASLFHRSWHRRPDRDHDHCEFCWAKFSETAAGVLREGWTTADEYRWICDNCFSDFRVRFGWTGQRHRTVRIVVAVVKAAAFATLAVVALAIVLTAGGVRSPFLRTEITHRQPYSNFIGREYRVTSDVRAYWWNEFPDKTKILQISLMPSPGIRNRFVSYVTPLHPGQKIRLVSAWRELPSFNTYYVVSVPGAGLPEGIQVSMAVNSDGIPDPRVYEPTDK